MENGTKMITLKTKQVIPRWKACPTTPESVGLAACFLGMTLLAILLTLGSAMSRADSERELVEGRVVDLVIVAPLWAAWVFIKHAVPRAIQYSCDHFRLCYIYLRGFLACCTEHLEAQHENFRMG